MLQEKVILPRMPLAIYRELSAHLEQLSGVETKLIPQTSSQFDYLESQVGGLIVTYNSSDVINSGGVNCRQQVSEILQYYSDRYCGSCLEKVSL